MLEALEDALAVLRRDAGTVVADGDLGVAVGTAQPDGHRRARRSGAQGVVEQYPQDLRDAARVPARPDDAWGQGIERDTLPARVELRDHGPGDLAELQGLVAQPYAGVEAAEVEQVATQAYDARRQGARACHLIACVRDVRYISAQLLVEQVEHATLCGTPGDVDPPRTGVRTAGGEFDVVSLSHRGTTVRAMLPSARATTVPDQADALSSVRTTVQFDRSVQRMHGWGLPASEGG